MGHLFKPPLHLVTTLLSLPGVEMAGDTGLVFQGLAYFWIPSVNSYLLLLVGPGSIGVTQMFWGSGAVKS